MTQFEVYLIGFLLLVFVVGMIYKNRRDSRERETKFLREHGIYVGGKVFYGGILYVISSIDQTHLQPHIEIKVLHGGGKLIVPWFDVRPVKKVVSDWHDSAIWPSKYTSMEPQGFDPEDLTDTK